MDPVSLRAATGRDDRDRWSYGMRRHGMARRGGRFGELFAERQVYLRSGLTSHYIVLSRRLQIGVTVAIGLIIAATGWASYSAIVQHFQLAGQSRELARLAEVNSSLRATADAAPAAEQLQTQAVRIPELSSALAAAETERERAEAEVERLRRDLEAARKDLAALRQSAQTAEANAADLRAQLAELRPEAPAGDGAQTLAELKQPATENVAELKATLAGARTRIAELTADLAAVKRPAADAPAAAAPAAGADGRRIADLQAQLDAAKQRIAELQAEIRQDVTDFAPLPPPAAPR
jgi:predicted  nucleic acid-binding Zn-ribbon protein